MEVVKTAVPIRCLVIQWGKFEDVLQSLMSLRSVQVLYPSLEIHVLVAKKYASLIQKVSWIQKAWVGKEEEVLLLLAEQPWDFVVNWSYFEKDPLICPLFQCQKMFLGYHRGQDGNFCASDGWSQYLYAISREKVSQTIHLTDIFTTQLLTALQIHVGESPFQQEGSYHSKTFFQLSYSPEIQAFLNSPRLLRKIISFQIDHGEPSFWSSLAHKILQADSQVEIHLLGKEDQLEKSEQILASFSQESPHLNLEEKRIQSWVGKTNFDFWTSILSRSDYLISGPSAGIHLASILGTRVLYLAEEENFYERGPYGNGHRILKSWSGKVWNAQAVYAVWMELQNHQEIPENKEGNSPFQEICLYRSSMRKSQEGGGVSYQLMTNHPMTLQEWFGYGMGYVARHWYCGWVPELGGELFRQNLNSHLLQQLRVVQDSSEVLMKIFKQSQSVALQLSKKNSQLVSKKLMDLKDRQEIQHLGSILTQLDLLVERLAHIQPLFSFFVQMNRVLMHHLQGKDLTELGQETAQSYRMLWEGAELLKNWTEVTFRLTKPVVLTSYETEQNWLRHEAPSA